ncbi:acetolactate decarboxylase [Aquiflexum sp. TKW24L]|uniref:acetolactate decarboxylase n=1 Tax=Aquiflexum sp. TKW24L TaxID=2942212 RepID=UPI0020C134C4|nr:acetolactate decarboxylase [Aquiflexum sp. TKW24L]MCL6259150.1 acetolactate decarboxylase [Aquiflexum sp. TKW24L]
MKKLSLLVFLILTSFLGYSQHGEIKSAGAMSEMGRNNFAPNISLDTLKKYPRIFGLGPLGKMQGEITLVDGIPFAGKADLDGKASIQKEWDVKAPFFVYGEVEEWESFPIDGQVTSMADLEKSIEQVALSKGFDLSKPFVFKISGEFDLMVTHIVTPRSEEFSGFKSRRNQENYTHENESGELIGFYSQIGKGIYTPQNSNIHIHFINDAQSFTGHLDKIETKLEGVIIYLPKRKKEISFKTTDTDFSKGRLGFQQEVGLDDMVKFHGHLCDGLVVGALGLNEALETLFPDGLIDRTDLRIVSKSSPCLTDVAVYLTGARYQFGTFYVDDAIEGLYVVQKISDGSTYQVNLKDGVKPSAIKEMEILAVQKELSDCQLLELRNLEDDFTQFLLDADAKEIFQIKAIDGFEWKPVLKGDFIKTDILNKNAGSCSL